MTYFDSLKNTRKFAALVLSLLCSCSGSGVFASKIGQTFESAKLPVHDVDSISSKSKKGGKNKKNVVLEPSKEKDSNKPSQGSSVSLPSLFGGMGVATLITAGVFGLYNVIGKFSDKKVKVYDKVEGVKKGEIEIFRSKVSAQQDECIYNILRDERCELILGTYSELLGNIRQCVYAKESKNFNLIKNDYMREMLIEMIYRPLSNFYRSDVMESRNFASKIKEALRVFSKENNLEFIKTCCDSLSESLIRAKDVVLWKEVLLSRLWEYKNKVGLSIYDFSVLVLEGKKECSNTCFRSFVKAALDKVQDESFRKKCTNLSFDRFKLEVFELFEKNIDIEKIGTDGVSFSSVLKNDMMGRCVDDFIRSQVLTDANLKSFGETVLNELCRAIVKNKLSYRDNYDKYIEAFKSCDVIKSFNGSMKEMINFLSRELDENHEGSADFGFIVILIASKLSGLNLVPLIGTSNNEDEKAEKILCGILKSNFNNESNIKKDIIKAFYTPKKDGRESFFINPYFVGEFNSFNTWYAPAVSFKEVLGKTKPPKVDKVILLGERSLENNRSAICENLLKGYYVQLTVSAITGDKGSYGQSSKSYPRTVDFFKKSTNDEWFDFGDLNTYLYNSPQYFLPVTPRSRDFLNAINELDKDVIEDLGMFPVFNLGLALDSAILDKAVKSRDYFINNRNEIVKLMARLYLVDLSVIGNLSWEQIKALKPQNYIPDFSSEVVFNFRSYSEYIPIMSVSSFGDGKKKKNSLISRIPSSGSGVSLEKYASWAYNYIMSDDLDLNDVREVIYNAYSILLEMKTCIDLKCEDGDVMILGDLHGEYSSVLLDAFNFLIRNPKGSVIFTGDYVDRGRAGLKCVLFVYLMLIVFPDRCYALAGNHEVSNCDPANVNNEIQFQFPGIGSQIVQNLYQSFGQLPLCVNFKRGGKNVFACHALPCELLCYEEKNDGKISNFFNELYPHKSSLFCGQNLFNTPSEKISKRFESIKSNPRYSFEQINELIWSRVGDKFGENSIDQNTINLAGALENSKVDIVVKGHDHRYGGQVMCIKENGVKISMKAEEFVKEQSSLKHPVVCVGVLNSESIGGGDAGYYIIKSNGSVEWVSLIKINPNYSPDRS